MELLKDIWSRIKALPAGVWTVLGAASALLFMYMRGRRLDAELAAEKLKAHAADVAVKTAKSEGKAYVHQRMARAHGQKARVIEATYAEISKLGKEAEKRLAAMPAEKVTREYLKIAKEEKIRNEGVN